MIISIGGSIRDTPLRIFSVQIYILLEPFFTNSKTKENE